jgi:hypothetical protein
MNKFFYVPVRDWYGIDMDGVIAIPTEEFLQVRLANRKRRPSREIFEDFGVPVLKEDCPVGK